MFNTIERVTALIGERGLTMQELARMSGINGSTLRVAAIRDSQLSISTVERICSALGMELWEFFAPERTALPGGKAGLPGVSAAGVPAQVGLPESSAHPPEAGNKNTGGSS